MKNVYYNKLEDNYAVRKRISGKHLHFGNYKTKEDAVAVATMLNELGWCFGNLLGIQYNLFGEVISKRKMFKMYKVL